MAQLVRNYVIGKLAAQVDNAVVDIDISFLRAAAPAAALVFDKYFFRMEVIERGKVS